MGGANVMREIGTHEGVFVGLFDIAKGAGAILIAQALNVSELWIFGTGFGALVGHNFPVFAGFRGGRGGAGPGGGAHRPRDHGPDQRVALGADGAGRYRAGARRGAGSMRQERKSLREPVSPSRRARLVALMTRTSTLTAARPGPIPITTMLPGASTW